MLEIRSFPTAILIRVHLDYDFGWTNSPQETVLRAAAGHDKQVILELNRCNQIDTHGLLSLSRLHTALGSRLEIVLSDKARVARIVRASGAIATLPMSKSMPLNIDAGTQAESEADAEAETAS